MERVLVDLMNISVVDVVRASNKIRGIYGHHLTRLQI